jgi:hypothetical protein
MKRSALIIGFVLSIVASAVLEKSYNYVVHGQFIISPFGGMHFVIAPLYLSSPQDSALFADTLQRSIFAETRKAMDENNLVPDEAELFNSYAYYLRFDKILRNHLLAIVAKHGCSDPVQTDQMLTAMACTLIKHNWMRQLHLYGNNIISYFGGYYFCALVGMLFLLSLYLSILHPNNSFSAISFVIMLAAIGNITATCLFISVQKRYSIYTDAFVVALIMIAVDHCFRIWSKKNLSFEKPMR